MALVRVASAPGIQRDGTSLSSQAYSDGVWCRWQRGLPRKMGGYKVTQAYLTAVSRALITQAQNGFRYVTSGHQSGLDQFTMDNFGVSSTVSNPTFPVSVGVQTISAVASSSGGVAVYTGTFPSGAANAFRGQGFTVAGFVATPANNGTFIVTASTTTTLTLNNTLAVAEAHAATATVVNPISGVTASQLNSWQFDTQFDNQSNSTLLFSFCGQNLLDPANAANFPVYYQNVYSPGGAVTQLYGYGTGSDGHTGTQQALFPNGVSGGLVSIAPYLILYGNNGFFAWSAPGFPTDFTGTSLGSLSVGATEITNQKIIKGLPLRGGGGLSPNGIFWSVDSVVRATFTGINSGTWNFDQLTCQSSILNDRSVIENNGSFFWAGTDRFLMFNGAIREIPNQYNLNWFYDNINQASAGKTFVMKIPRYGEIWWCYPRGNSVECSHAVIYNYREGIWYDTPLPNTGRSSGLHADNLVGNIMGGLLPYSSSVSGTPTTYFNLWEHEQGTDEINGQFPVSVPSSFTTSAFTNFNANPPNDLSVTINSIQPDLLMTGDMTVTAIKQNNANAAPYTGNSAVIYANPVNQLDNITNLKDTAKIINLQFSSNVLGGNYQMGQTMADIGTDGGRDT